MWKSEVSIEIAAPVEMVYARLADFEHHSDFSRGLASLEKTTAGPVGVGTRFKAHETAPMKFVSYSEITALEPSERIAWKAWMPGMMRTHWQYLLTPTGSGTHLVQRTEWNGASIQGSLMLHLVRRKQAPRENQATMEAIRAVFGKGAVA